MIKLLDILKENNNFKNQLEDIANIVYKKYPEINKGLCFDFAYLIGKNLNIKEAVLIYNQEEDKDFGEPIHTALIIDNMFYDANGFQTFNELKNNWRGDFDTPFIEKIKIYELEDYLKNNKSFTEFLNYVVNNYV